MCRLSFASQRKCESAGYLQAILIEGATLLTCKQLFLVLLFATVGSAPIAFADTVSLKILNPVQSGPAGTVFTYMATISAPSSNSAPEFLTGDSVTTFGGPFTIDDTDFFGNFPSFLNSGDSFTDNLFTIAASAGSAGTTPMGSFVLQGGLNSGDQFDLASADFGTTATVTPEPPGLLLLATGTMGMLAIVRRRGRSLTAI